MKQKYSAIMASSLTKIINIAVIVIMILNIVIPDHKQSETENRPLQTFPSLNMEHVLSGQYGKDLNTWFSDQFIFRDQNIHVKYLIQKFTGVKEIQGVYLTKRGLIEKTSEVNKKQLDRNLKAINSFKENNPDLKVGFMLAPNAVSIEKDSLPKSADCLDQNKQMDDIYNRIDDSIKKIDLRSTLEKHKDEYLYYKTDHHWTSLASYYSYQKLASSFKLDKTNKNDYKIYPVADSFEGTLANKTGSMNIKDEIDIYVPKTKTDYVVTDESTNKKSRTIYHSEALETKDQYAVFMGGNKSLFHINIDNDSNKHLLLIKDSYANSLIPFLIPEYASITVIDPRYYFDDYTRLIQNDLITDVLFMYNSNTFVQDTSLADMLQAQ
ncbi:DHHW family protein [uncultured Holdemanella sp.]|uniref:DHHW family protein n=1 Tax=uncultured Holdemanella sp. TaxID=1763549 RepID=UPI0025F0858F|nr:DHHW family protein [uncultured Holdemanella sp.]